MLYLLDRKIHHRQPNNRLEQRRCYMLEYTETDQHRRLNTLEGMFQS